MGIYASQRRGGQARISGMGGKRENAELWYEMAIRETVKELFHIRYVSSELIIALLVIKPVSVIFQKDPDYTCIVYSLNQLPLFLSICQKFIQSPIYSTFPKTLTELLEKRLMQRDAEIMQFILWPREITQKRYRLSCDLLQDLQSMEHFSG